MEKTYVLTNSLLDPLAIQVEWVITPISAEQWVSKYGAEQKNVKSMRSIHMSHLLKFTIIYRIRCILNI